MIASVVAQLLAGWLIADFLSGLFHWWEDRCGDVGMPILGPMIVVPNRLHHSDPLSFTRASFVSRNWPVWIIAALIAAAWLTLGGPLLMLAAALAGGLAVNEVHVCAHLPGRGGPAIQVLQQMGLIQSPPHHAGHHRAPQNRAYCVLTNLLNPGLDAIGFWRGLEAVLTWVGLEPNRGAA